MPSDKLVLGARSDSKVKTLLIDLLKCGLSIEQGPADGQIARNGIKIIIKSHGFERRLRIFVYSSGESARARPHERRIQITTTYLSGLTQAPGYSDVVLGYDEIYKKYIGVDPRRLFLGGQHHNASSFFDFEGLLTDPGEIFINPRSAHNMAILNGSEWHAFFDGSRILEYLFNQSEIHAGHYSQAGLFSTSVNLKSVNSDISVKRSKLKDDYFILATTPTLEAYNNLVIPDDLELIEAIELHDLAILSPRKISPAQLLLMQQKCIEIGNLGEQVVLQNERKRLNSTGKPALAIKVERVSLKSVCEGYDILSYEYDINSKKHIEVKSTIGSGAIVDISRGEWKAAERLRNKYYIARVFNVRSHPTVKYIQDPFALQASGNVHSTETGWKLDLSGVLKG